MANLFSQNFLFSEDLDIKKLENNVELKIKQKKFDFSFVEQVFNIAYYYQHSDPIKGLEYVKKILLIPEIFENEDLLSIIYTKYGNIHSELDKNDLAVKYLMDGLRLAKKNKKLGSYYWISVDLGNVFFKLKEYKKAIENYQVAVSGFEQMNDLDIKIIYHARAVANENTALAYANLNNYDSAIHYFRISHNFRYQSKSQLGIKLVNYNLGKFFYSNGQLDSAYTYLQRSLSMTDFFMELPGINFEYSRYHIKALFLLSIYFNKIKNQDSSKFYFIEALKWTDKSLTLSPRILLLNQTSELFFKEKYYKVSLELAQKANKLIMDSMYYTYLPTTNKLLSDAYFELGDFKNAMKFRKEYDKLIDTTFLISQLKSIELEIGSYDLKNKMNDIQIQKEEKERELSQLYKIGIWLIIIIGIIVLFFVILIKLNKDKKNLNKQLLVKNEELNAINQELRDSQNEVQQVNEELMSLNDQLRNINFDLEESNNTKNKLFSIIAHDFKNGIGSSINLIDLLNTSYDDLSTDEKREYVELIAQTSNRVYKLLENLLTWSSTLRGKVKPNLELNNLYSVAQNSVNLYEQKANEKQIVIINLIKKDLGFVFDASLIDAVIRNILNNSVKYSLSKGKIYLDAQNDENCVLLSIKDEGVGMPAEKAEGIFKSQFNKSTDGTLGEKGTGLGLMICYEFIKLHNGDIWFESEINNGTTCKIKLPTT